MSDRGMQRLAAAVIAQAIEDATLPPPESRYKPKKMSRTLSKNRAKALKIWRNRQASARHFLAAGAPGWADVAGIPPTLIKACSAVRIYEYDDRAVAMNG